MYSPISLIVVPRSLVGLVPQIHVFPVREKGALQAGKACKVIENAEGSRTIVCRSPVNRICCSMWRKLVVKIYIMVFCSIIQTVQFILYPGISMMIASRITMKTSFLLNDININGWSYNDESFLPHIPLSPKISILT